MQLACRGSIRVSRARERHANKRVFLREFVFKRFCAHEHRLLFWRTRLDDERTGAFLIFSLRFKTLRATAREVGCYGVLLQMFQTDNAGGRWPHAGRCGLRNLLILAAQLRQLRFVR